MDLMAETKSYLQDRLQIPADYEICFVSSATECWEIVAQSLVKEQITIGFNGAFGEKWAGYTSEIAPESKAIAFDISQPFPVSEVLATHPEVIGLVQCETSNGTQVDQSLIKDLRDKSETGTIIAVDATSSMAGVKLDFPLADVWYASVQKCFGLPSGMAVMILSPRAVEKAYEVGHKSTYNSLISIIENTQKNQTHYTPNILNIYLLNKTQQYSKGIDYQHEKLTQRFQNWSQFVDQTDGLDWLIEDPSLRATTVLTLLTKKPEKLKKAAAQKDIILGNGYGQWKETTIRIANFPAIKGKEVERLVKFLERYFD